ncbi:MAG: Asp-tRNA(Asn)/Glu-tRNA(Gln) amidotransferase subunit GatB [Acidobacteria bacterium]|nr:MAG: Asp-tRNA(Asn)/Glu-tRNA(Gln) amidotransferase subunit GatB [Acidobacteriota bacterium]
MDYEAVIGLEVHAQLLTKSKIFCGCSTAFGAPPNSNTCPVCLGLPGALPVLNREAVAMAIKAGLALGCTVNNNSIFARKNYFYPDLPKGYQISQFELPLASDGRVSLKTGERQKTGHITNYRTKTFGIIRVHLEEDAGKSIHMPGDDTYVDLNRTGVPLIEIVSAPDLRSSQEAYDYMSHLRRTLLYLGICDGNMEEGSLRCDANVSVRPVGCEKLGTKVEVKNLNSFRFLQKALDFEIERQIRVVEEGGKIVQETRLWNDDLGRTFSMRTKEEAHDYRYFPDPDLLPVVVDHDWLEDLKGEIPELPEARRDRLVTEYGLPDEDAMQVTQTRPFADYFESAAEASGNPRQVFNWMVGELTRFLKQDGREIEASPVSPPHLAALIKLIEAGSITGKIGKEVFDKMYQTGKDPEEIVAAAGFKQISDQGQIEQVIDRVLQANPGQVKAFRAGKEGLLGFFVGQVMRETRGQANPKVVNDLLLVKLRG